MSLNAKIRVLVIDDSAMVRHVITDTLNADPEIEVVGVANDPLIAIEKMPRLLPDVLTLDMEMPRMDGLTFLRKLKAEGSRIPVVVISSLTQHGSQAALAALEAGAIDVLGKPDGSTSVGALAPRLAFHVKAAARARRRSALPALPAAARADAAPASPATAAGSGAAARAGGTGSAILPAAAQSAQEVGAGTVGGGWRARGLFDRRLIMVGSSTGGVEALRFLLPSLPEGLPPIAVVQHIPAHFSKAVADRINDLAPYEVREAVDDEPLTPGLCLIAPGNFHMAIVNRGGYRTRLTQSPPVHHCRPAVDILFRSGAEVAGSHALAVLLTGMGSDGALGMQFVKRAGGRTLAEHEDSCVVYGMPRAAVQLGVVDHSVRLAEMPGAMLQAVDALPA